MANMEGDSKVEIFKARILKSREIWADLDSLALRVLRLMNDFIRCKLDIEKVMKSGSLDLAKARYIMGNRNVSSLQLPTEDSAEVSPLVTVVSSKDVSGSLTYNLERILPQKSPAPSGVKNRNVESKDEDGEEFQPLLSEEKTSFQDPLKWFGVLVPQNLRQGQTWFQKAIELSIQCANIQSEIDASIVSYKELLRKKRDYSDIFDKLSKPTEKTEFYPDELKFTQPS